MTSARQPQHAPAWRFPIAGAFVAVVLAACSGLTVARPTAPRAAAIPVIVPADPRPVRSVPLAEVGLDASIMDRSANACDDLYQLACGHWLASTPIPEDSWGWERSFGQMRTSVEENLKAMLERDASDSGGDATRKMLGDFYASCMDEVTIDATKTKPIQPVIDRLERAGNREEVVRVLAGLEGVGVYALVHTDVAVDDLDSSRMTAALRETGWGLNRKQYVDSDAKSIETRRRYGEMLRALFGAAGVAPGSIDRRVRSALTVETLLSISDDPSGDARRKPTKFSLADLVRQAPAFPWAVYVTELGLGKDTTFSVVDVASLGRLSDVIANQPLEALRDYALARVLHDLAYVLSNAFTDAKFRLASFRDGVKKRKPRWRECVKITEHTLPRAIVRSYASFLGFDRDDPALRGMVDDIYQAWKERLGEVAWLDPPTRDAAIRKLSAMPYHIGYPDYVEVEQFRFDRASFAENTFRADRAKRGANLAKVGKSPDPAEWTRSPLEVNAYHDHERNSVFIHIAMLAPPIYDPRASVAVRYGAMGMVIGHELAHGFDHHGAEFDERGTRRDWWSEATKAEFAVRRTCFENQFSTYDVLPGLKVDGKLSVGENIADVAGLRMAFRAYRKRRSDAAERVVAEGFSEDQQFFLARAQAWCVVMTEQAARESAKTNPHIAPRWAVDGPVHHLTEFHEAFGCEVPKDVCSLW